LKLEGAETQTFTMTIIQSSLLNLPSDLHLNCIWVSRQRLQSLSSSDKYTRVAVSK